MKTTCTEPYPFSPKRRTLLLSMAVLPFAPAMAWAQADEGLTLAFVPQEDPEKLLGDIRVITEWLGGELGMPVRGFVTSDHAAAVEALRNGDADISFMGALPYVLANEYAGATAILQEVYFGRPYYTARLFVRRDSGIAELADLRGKTIAFADPISESGYYYPLDLFAEAGLFQRGDDPRTFFDRVLFAGGYQQAIQAVANGLVDAAGASQYADMLLTPGQQLEVTWIAESRPIPSHSVIARGDLAPDLRDAFVSAMLRLNEPDLRYLLQYVYGPDGYVVADLAAYEEVRTLARAYGLLR
ncbi:phosphate/phosphite/phosphonate ABC transporter substrate-binding protein [Pelagibacterium sp. 26DY04]|uniref:phosphate/phosphite/phosphonate ABC transporter substrate-binding protein n=1 Tax=Pelagibacterium sp. 26DY04 TaxID=2967130 RepID=UPI0028161A49|nr:phosphate/phosphite/phosphonate ABC transporter substrate-binding protein [Pelagibacterium sp. 26DY04]WMT86478.1 phosphate/phosphite/phosphonate ABC transporter substrate-binding protein [Pelagibacterium sp. 26DY04]